MRCSPFSPRRGTTAARLTLLALVIAMFTAFLVPSTASAAGGESSDYVARINSLRASVGVGPLQVDGALTAAAQSWADHMAATQTLAHAPDIGAGLSVRWTKLGENVGVGPNNASIWPAFVASAHHYANIVDPAFNYVGVGVAYGGGRQYTCHRFMQSGGGSQAPAPTPAPKPATPRPTTAPKPATPTTTAPAATNVPAAPPAPPVSPTGPPPPADSTRVATVLSALRQLNS